MSLASNQLLKTIYKGQNPNEKQVRLARYLDKGPSNTIKVQFFGEDEPSNINYKTFYGFSTPNINSTVVMEKINGTSVATGRF